MFAVMSTPGISPRNVCSIRIRSAILFADMRGFTRLTANLSPEEAVQLLNGYFDCLVPPIEAEGGEVLKYIAGSVAWW